MDSTECLGCCFQHGVSAAELSTRCAEDCRNARILCSFDIIIFVPASSILSARNNTKYCMEVKIHLQYEKNSGREKIVSVPLSRSLYSTELPSKKFRFLTHNMIGTINDFDIYLNSYFYWVALLETDLSLSGLSEHTKISSKITQATN